MLASKRGVDEMIRNHSFYAFPGDSALGWTVRDFGPLYVPAKGDSVGMNSTHYAVYRNLIEWEQRAKLVYREGNYYLNGKRITGYRFQENYYFMGGDNCYNSQDSRYWGLLPESYIVGKTGEDMEGKRPVYRTNLLEQNMESNRIKEGMKAVGAWLGWLPVVLALGVVFVTDRNVPPDVLEEAMGLVGTDRTGCSGFFIVVGGGEAGVAVGFSASLDMDINRVRSDRGRMGAVSGFRTVCIESFAFCFDRYVL